MQRPTLRQLEYFTALAQHLNFRVAAEASFVGQPTLSEQIAQLEALVGLRLFERGRKVTLTPAGEALLPAAETILAATDGLLETARSLGKPLAGPLRLGVIPTVGPYLLPTVVPAIRRRHPDLELFLREDQTNRLVEGLESGALDVLLLDLGVDLGGLETHALFADPFLLGVSVADELSERTEVRLEDLADRSVLLLEEGHCLRQQTLQLCEAFGGSEQAGFRASSLGTVTQMVAAGLGVTLIPELSRERECAAAPDLRTIPFDAEGPGRMIGLAWRKSSPRADEYRLLGETIAGAYASS
ncbi:MAG: LysR substrate-binding domain-containing protein [Planctomycetota bacterium]